MKLSRLGLWTIILLLLVTNIVTFIIFLKDEQGNHLVDNMKIKDQDRLMATIDSEEIYYQDWVDQLINQYGEQVMNGMVNKEVVRQLAKEKDFSMEPKIIDRELARIMSMQRLLSEEEREDKRSQWREQIEYRYLLQYLLTENMQIDEQKIQNYFQEYKGQYHFNEMVQLSHILVQTKAEAEHVLAKLDEGSSFKDVAEEFSIDKDTSYNGGYLGFYTETSSFIPGSYFDEAITLEEGTYSEPIHTNKGYAIIYHHQYLQGIELTYEEAHEEVRQDLALDQLEVKVDARHLWDQLEVELLYDE